MSESNKEIVAKNTLFQLIGKVFTMGVTVFITLMITRIYGRELYGDYSLMQGFPALFFIITDFGLNAISVKHASKDRARLFHYFLNVLIFRVIFSAVIIAVIIVALGFFPYAEELKFGIRLSLLLILTFGLYSSTNIIFQTKLRYDLSVIGQITGYLLILFAVIFLVQERASVVWISFSYVLGGLLTFGVNLLLIYRLDIKKTFFFDLPLIKRLFKEALPLGITFIFTQMNFKEDALFISVLRMPEWLEMNHSEAVGVYSLPYKIFEVSLVFPTFFMNAVYPILVNNMEEGPEKLLRNFKKALVFLAFTGFIGGVVGVILSPLIVGIFGAEEFRYSIYVLRILMGGVVLFYLTQPLSWFLVTLGRQRYLPYIYFVSVVFNVIFNIIFIPRYSFFAAATITIISEFMILILLGYFCLKSWKEVYHAV